MTDLAENFSSLCRTCLHHEPRETHDVALARFSSFAKGLAALGTWAEKNAALPAILLTPHAVPLTEDDVELRDFMASNDLMVDGVEVHEAPDPYACGIGLYQGRGSSKEELEACEDRLHDKDLPRPLHSLLTQYGWLRLNAIGSVSIDCGALAPLDDALADWLAAVEQQEMHTRYLLFAGDLEDGWVIDLASHEGAIYRFSQDDLAERMGEQQRRGDATSFGTLDNCDANLEAWLSQRVDDLICELADYVGITIR